MIYEIASSEMYNPETKEHKKRKVLLKTTSLFELVNCIEGFGYEETAGYTITAYTNEGMYFTECNLADWLMLAPKL